MCEVAIVIGHHPDAGGAGIHVRDRVISEYQFWLGFGRALVDSLCDVDAELVERPNPEPDDELARRVNETGARCAIELHYNSVESPDASGTEMLHYPGSNGGKKLAHFLHDGTVDALGTVRRGLKHRPDFVFLRETEMTAVIAEPCFGSSESDAWALLTRQGPLLLAYKRAISRWLTD